MHRLKNLGWICLLASAAAPGCIEPPEPSITPAPSFEVETSEADRSSESAALALFEARILPIFRSEKPSSCAECHLSGVDLKDYVRPTQAETFAALVGQGLIDVDRPDESKLLKLIDRRPEKPSLVTDEARAQELAAFRAWIRAAVRDPALLSAKSEEPIGPSVSMEVVRHARTDRVLASFTEQVWSEVERCAACHSPDRNQKQVREHGEQVSWIVLGDAEATLARLKESALIDVKRPEESLLLKKPLGQVEHGGGQKMAVGDRTYKQFRRFLDDYAAVVEGGYATPESLPSPSDELSRATDIWLKFSGVPQKYDKMLLQVDLYRPEGEGWSATRAATSDRLVFGEGRLWQHSLSLTAKRGTPWTEELSAGKLPPGRYMAKIYVDAANKLAQNPWAELGEDDLVGQVEFESEWPAGYGKMTVVQFPGE